MKKKAHWNSGCAIHSTQQPISVAKKSLVLCESSNENVQNCQLPMTHKEKAMATHSDTLAWKIPQTEEPDGLQSMGSWRVGHDWATSLSLFTFMHWRRKWQPTQCSCLENPRDRGAWWAASMESHIVRHDWSDLAAAAAAHGFSCSKTCGIFLDQGSNPGPLHW